MKICPEIMAAIDEICDKYAQSEDFKSMLKSLIENKMEDNLNPNDIDGLVQKVELNED